MLQPSLISRMQTELKEGLSEDYARQFLTALRQEMKVERNEKAIAASQARLKQGGN
jgi:peptidyl-prolyl cis-trans isomerase D